MNKRDRIRLVRAHPAGLSKRRPSSTPPCSIEPNAQISVKAAVQALPTEQGQRIDAAVATPPVPPKVG